jgi:excisionase family DNA binding protein
MLTTREAAVLLHVTPSRILKLIAAGRLPATKHGRDWWLTEQAIAAYQPHPNGRRGGRPRKEQTP